MPGWYVLFTHTYFVVVQCPARGGARERLWPGPAWWQGGGGREGVHTTVTRPPHPRTTEFHCNPRPRTAAGCITAIISVLVDEVRPHSQLLEQVLARHDCWIPFTTV